MDLAVAAGWLLLEDHARWYGALVEGLRVLAKAGRGDDPPIVRDGAGQRRAVYHPFVVHLHVAAFARRYEGLSDAQWSACEAAIPDALAPLRTIAAFADRAPPARAAAVVLWQALGVLEAGLALARDVDVELAESVVGATLAHNNAAGALHPMSANESLDGWTYDELAAIHALSRLALARRNPTWARRLRDAVIYHLHNSQPDNTTTQPWGLFAFVWTSEARSLAQQQLHDVRSHAASSGTMPLVSALLLADAADALVAFDKGSR